MQIRNLGGSGLRVSAVGLGCNNFGQRTDLETSRKVIHKAIDLGITLFDTADIYAGMGGSETVLGTVLGDRRKDIVLATKYSKPMSHDGTRQGASRRYIMSAVEASLTRLKTDYIDLYQQHDYDPLTPIEETLRALDDLVRQGKVRYIGNSNFPAWRIAEAEYVARAMNVNRFVSCQDEYSLVVRDIEKDLLPAATEYNLGLLPFFPLASGLLTGKYQRGATAPADTRFAKAPALKDRYVTPRNEDIVEKLQAFAKSRGHTMLELAFSWLASRPQVSSVIAGATRVEQVEQNVKAIGWTLSAEELAEIDRITKIARRSGNPLASSRRTPGPITTGVRGDSAPDLQRVRTIRIGGYGSRLALRLAGMTRLFDAHEGGEMAQGALELHPHWRGCPSHRGRARRSAGHRPLQSALRRRAPPARLANRGPSHFPLEFPDVYCEEYNALRYEPEIISRFRMRPSS